jgi:two-component system, response regulator
MAMDEAMEILLVEDDPREARLTVRELQNANLKNKIELARDGEEALDFMFCRGAYTWRSITHPPTLVLLDLKLPKLDGIQVLREIKAHPEAWSIPVVILTSSREEKDLVQSYKLGVSGQG